MATIQIRGKNYNVVYPYKDDKGAKKTQWETYQTELEALQRKTYIDYLQKNKLYGQLAQVAAEYRANSQAQKQAEEMAKHQANPMLEPKDAAKADNLHKTFGEFVEKWLPFHVRKERLSPNTYDSYRCNLDNHILPVFGDRIMSTITTEDIDDFLDQLSIKPCKGPKANRLSGKIPLLSSSSVKKCYTVLMAGFPDALKWHYIERIPETTAPSEKTEKRNAWVPAKVYEVLETIKDDPLLHLGVHIGFVCSLRAGEVSGIEIKRIDFQDNSMWIIGQIQRVTDKALSVLPENEVLHIYPKHLKTGKSSLIYKGTKTEKSWRKQYLTVPLIAEIKERLAQIERDKAYFGSAYTDNGLLFCQPDGRPLEPKMLDKCFKEHQRLLHIPEEEQIEFQGLRKSGQMHKIRLSQNNYQLVAENSGQSPEVLMHHYNEALESEKRALAAMVEQSFYPGIAETKASPETASIMDMLGKNPELASQILKNLLLGSGYAQPARPFANSQGIAKV